MEVRLNKIERLNATFDFFEHICGGEDAASQTTMDWPEEYIAKLFAEMSARAAILGLSPRKTAITLWSILMNALVELTRNEVRH